MRTVSKFSATMIGIHEHDDPTGELSKKIYVDEAKEIATAMRRVHHSRKLSHQQVYYPETVKKLGQIQSAHDQSRTTRSATASAESRREESSAVYQAKEMKLRDFQQRFTEHIKKEHFINHRKRNYNREVGRKAVVNQIIGGTAQMPKYELFPQGATHEQILALTNTLKAPDANKLPPEVPSLRKWKGDHVGWGDSQVSR